MTTMVNLSNNVTIYIHNDNYSLNNIHLTIFKWLPHDQYNLIKFSHDQVFALVYYSTLPLNAILDISIQSYL